jgi:hypothetical protein
VTVPSETPDACSGLDETTCRATTGCHAAYHDQAINDVSVFSFDTCTGPAPLETDGCWDLDEETCAQYDNCTTVRKIDTDGSIYFADCEGEGDQPPNKDPGDPVDAGTLPTPDAPDSPPCD